MEVTEQAKFIDHFLRELYNASFATSLAMGIEMSQLPSKENKEKFKTLEYILEELNLVELVRGRDNSTLGGQCEYNLSGKGRELVEKNESSIGLLLQREMKNEIKGNPLFDEKEWDKYYDKLLKKRADQADFFLDMIIEKKLINLDKPTLRNYFKEWFNENQEFDLQIKDGDLAIEDGDLQTVPDFNKENIPEFVKWFQEKGNEFMDFLKEKGLNVEDDSKEQIINQSIGEENKKNYHLKEIIIGIIITVVGGIILNLIPSPKEIFGNKKNSSESVFQKPYVIIENYKIKALNETARNLDTLLVKLKYQGSKITLNSNFKLIDYEFYEKRYFNLGDRNEFEPELELIEVNMPNPILDSLSKNSEIQLEIKRKLIFDGHKMAYFEENDKERIGNLRIAYNYEYQDKVVNDTLTSGIYIVK